MYNYMYNNNYNDYKNLSNCHDQNIDNIDSNSRIDGIPKNDTGRDDRIQINTVYITICVR